MNVSLNRVDKCNEFPYIARYYESKNQEYKDKVFVELYPY